MGVRPCDCKALVQIKSLAGNFIFAVAVNFTSPLAAVRHKKCINLKFA